MPCSFLPGGIAAAATGKVTLTLTLCLAKDPIEFLIPFLSQPEQLQKVPERLSGREAKFGRNKTYFLKDLSEQIHLTTIPIGLIQKYLEKKSYQPLDPHDSLCLYPAIKRG